MLLTLPNELLLEVLQHLPNTSDVYCLLLTTKQLTGLVQPVLEKAAKRIQDNAKEKRMPLLHFATFENDLTIGKLALKLEPGCINAFHGRRGSALHIASWKGYGKMARFLLAHGANPNAINLASPLGDSPLDLALDNMFQPLSLSSSPDNHAEVAQQLILAGADPNKLDDRGQNALIQAATGRVPELISTILDTGVVDINSQNNEGETALHLAAWMQDPRAIQIVEILLKRGIDVNAIDRGGATALCFSNKRDVTALLVEYGADVNVADYRGQTILHKLANVTNQAYALMHIQELLNSCFVVDVSLRDSLGYSALDYARYNNNSQVVMLFEGYLAGLT